MSIRFKKRIAMLISAVMVLTMAFQSLAAAKSYEKPENMAGGAVANPVKVTGTWAVDAQGDWRFSSPDGEVKNGWFYLNKSNSSAEYAWYCFDENGIMKTGWVNDKNDPTIWYYTGETKDASEGSLMTGWITDPQDKKKYYLDPATGVMCSGWKQISGTWYYFGERQHADRIWGQNTTGYWTAGKNGTHSYGSLYMNEFTPDGYYVGSNGAWVQNYNEDHEDNHSEKPVDPVKPKETKTIAEILPSGFPTSADSAWVNAGSQKAYQDGNNIKVGNLTIGTDATVTKSGDNYVYTAGNTTVTFTIKDGAVKSITVSGSGSEGSDGTYAASAVETKTISEILPEGFPTSADSAWVNAGSQKAYQDGTDIKVGNLTLGADTAVIKNGDNYVYTSGNTTVTFTIKNGAVESITVSGSEGSDGTYAASAVETKTISEILPSGFPTSADSAWVNARSQKAYQSGSSVKIGSLTIGTDAAVTKSGDNYVYTSGNTTVTFTIKNGVVESITVSGSADSDGTYAASAVETKTIAEILPAGFPTSADSAWVNAGSQKAYQAGSSVKIGNLTLGTDATVTKSGDNYVYTSGNTTVTFTIKNGAVESITVSGSADSNGTYVAPETKKISEILPSGFPTSADFAWATTDGKKAYQDGTDIKVGKLTLGTDTTVTKNGDNYVCTSGNATVTFTTNNGAVESITVTGSADSDGTYTAPAAVKYMDWDADKKELVEQSTSKYIEVTADTTVLDAGKFYVVKGADVKTGSLTVNGTEDNPTTLIICDGAKLTTTGDDTNYTAGIQVASDKALVITGQKNDTGILIANGGTRGSGIGGGFRGSSGTVTINGGKVTATGNNGGAGIGGGVQGSSNTVTINGGTVEATVAGYNGAAGIGGGFNGSSDTVTINGGTVTATGNAGGAGIGGGTGTGRAGDSSGSSDTVTINGGTVTATGADGGEGIGKGKDGSTSGTVTFGEGMNFTINAGDNAASAQPKTIEEYANDHSAIYVSIEGFVPETKKISEILPSGFPASADFAWATTDGKKAYQDGTDIKVGKLTLGTDTTVIKNGDNYVCTSGNATVTFTTNNGAVESIIVTGLADSNGTYVAPETKKLSEILPSGFPTSADFAWATTDGKKAYQDENGVKIGNLTLGADATVTRNGDNYVCKSGDATVTFNVKDGAAESITVTGSSDSNGIYTAPETKKLSEILPSGFPTSADFAWVNADGQKAYQDENGVKIGNLTLGADATVTKNGDNYVCKSGDATVTFNVKDGAAESITVTGSSDSNGIYTVPETKKLSEILPAGFPTTVDSAWVNVDGKKAYRDGDNIKVGNLTLGKDSTVTKNGDSYVCKSGDATVTFSVKDGVVESITVSGSADSDGTYAAPLTITFKDVTGGAVYDAETTGSKITSISVPNGTSFTINKNVITIGSDPYYAIADDGYIFNSFGLKSGTITADMTITAGFSQFTVGNLLNTVENFPGTSAGGWRLKTNPDKTCYTFMMNLVLGEYKVLMTKKVNKQTNGDYIYEESGAKITFVMSNGVLTSIKLEKENDSENSGEYAKIISTVGDVFDTLGDTAPTADIPWIGNEGEVKCYLDQIDGGLILKKDLIRTVPRTETVTPSDNDNKYTCQYNDGMFDVTIIFIMDNDVLTSINVTGYTGDYEDFNDIYAPGAPSENKTLKQLIDLQTGFPTTVENGWVNSSNPEEFLWYGNYDSFVPFTGLLFGNSQEQYSSIIGDSDKLTKITDGYQYDVSTGYPLYTVTVKMDGNVITSVILESTNSYQKIVGTYVPAPVSSLLGSSPVSAYNDINTEKSTVSDEAEKSILNEVPDVQAVAYEEIAVPATNEVTVVEEVIEIKEEIG